MIDFTRGELYLMHQLIACSDFEPYDAEDVEIILKKIDDEIEKQED